MLREGCHSGDAGGIVPDPYRVSRILLSRVEDQETGKILLPEFHAVRLALRMALHSDPWGRHAAHVLRIPPRRILVSRHGASCIRAGLEE